MFFGKKLENKKNENWLKHAILHVTDLHANIKPGAPVYMSSARLLKSVVASHVTHFFSSLHRIRFYRRHHHHHRFRLYWLEHCNSSPIRLVVVSKSVHHYGSSQALFCKTASDWGIYSWSLIGWFYVCGS